jgi:hypothetical protein
MADFSRHDNLVALLRRSRTPVAIPSLGVVPKEIARVGQSPLDGWQMKRKGLTRTLAFWLNQGAAFVLIHSAYEPGRSRAGEMEHSLIPHPIAPESFRWVDAPPLATLAAFCRALDGAKPIREADELSFRFALDPDPVLIPATGSAGPMRTSDLVALLSFQLDERRFAVAAYVVTPNVAVPMPRMAMTLQADRAIEGVPWLLRPYNGLKVQPRVVRRAADSFTMGFELTDDVTWLVFGVAPGSSGPPASK